MNTEDTSIVDYIRKGSFYQTVVEDGADIIFIVDYEGNIFYHNPSVKLFLGYDEGELIGKNFIASNHPDYQEKLKRKFREISGEQYADNIEFYFRRKDGDYTYLEFNSINLHHKDQINALLLDCRDISQRKKDAEELVKAQKAKELFLANMSHEIRTPISGIAGMVALLEKSNRNPEERKYLNAIKHSADHLKVIINDILDFAAIEAGKLVFEKIGFKPYEEVKNVVNSFEFNVKEKGLAFDFNFSGDQNLIIKGDPVRLNQVLVNLINNAIKFTPAGRITLDMSASEVYGKILVHFCVKDTGIGIPQDKQENLFESFSQADASISRRFGGTGLGLAICKHIVTIQGGKIWFESEANKGSAFYFEIPFDPGKLSDLVTTDHLKDSGSQTLAHLNVLLAEDNEINMLYTTKVLKDLGCNVVAVEDGQSCTETLATDNFDLILMDLQMPVMDGFQATRVIRESFPEPKKNIPIVALTANAIKGDNEKCIEAGMNDYLSKPFTPQNLKKIILKWIPSTPGEEKGSPEEAVINLDYLRQICNGDENFIKEMIATFRKSTPAMLMQIESALLKNDFTAISRIAHKLKPSLSFMGIQSAQQLAIEIENVKNAPAPEGYEKLASDFISTIKKALKQLEMGNYT